MSEQVLATIKYSTEQEIELNEEMSLVEVQAKSIEIINNDTYQMAVLFGRTIKAQQSKVKEFFEPMKQIANTAHKTICAKEKEALAPLLNAESIIKKCMTEYQIEVERKRRAEEEELRRKQREESERIALEAAKLEEQGKTEQANEVMAEALAVESISHTITVSSETPKATGAAIKKDWDIVITDVNLVPISIVGAVIRPVDEAAIKRVVRALKGAVSIPGVKIIETANVSLRK